MLEVTLSCPFVPYPTSSIRPQWEGEMAMLIFNDGKTRRTFPQRIVGPSCRRKHPHTHTTYNHRHDSHTFPWTFSLSYVVTFSYSFSINPSMPLHFQATYLIHKYQCILYIYILHGQGLRKRKSVDLIHKICWT